MHYAGLPLKLEKKLQNLSKKSYKFFIFKEIYRKFFIIKKKVKIL